MSDRLAIVAALDALEDGDARLAADILLGALEADGPTDRPYRCPSCRASFEWPGLLDHHRRFAHAVESEAT